MDYSILLFYISILVIIYGIHILKRKDNIIKRKINIPKIKYTDAPKDSYYTKTFGDMFNEPNRLLLRI